ncbi:hypothetical protein [uncultured Parasphingorhabdus sp.]|uniref:hypothetical protein n=1 Tax=uncultured Parasphingorhabdus sp. TaxID=2709694 RepID=UPI0030D7959A|tara:strand:+ start:14775 stop:15371 length:597 start_codon:yes stop_codon:yes gene_type:complete
MNSGSVLRQQIVMIFSGKPEELGFIDKDDGMPAIHLDKTTSREIGESPADRMDRQAEEIGDIASGHGKPYLGIIVSLLVEAEQESCQPFWRGPVTHDKLISLGTGHRAKQHGDGSFKLRLGAGFSRYVTNTVTFYQDVGDGFRGRTVIAVIRTKHVTGKIEAGQMPLPVYVKPTGPDGAADNFVPTRCLLALVENQLP